MGKFFKETQDNQAMSWVTKFRTSLAAKRMLNPSSLMSTLAAFRGLRRRYTPERIEEVLNWYCDHLGEEYIPKVVNGKNFALRFEDIAKAMNRDFEAEEISAESKVLALRLSQQEVWPVEVLNALAAIIDRSQKNWADFRHRIMAYVQGQPINKRILEPDWVPMDQETGFLSQIMLSHYTFVEGEWLKLIQQQVGWKEHYLGSPMDLAFSPKSDRFRDSFWRAWSRSWCGQPKRHDQLLDKLLKEG